MHAEGGNVITVAKVYLIDTARKIPMLCEPASDRKIYRAKI